MERRMKRAQRRETLLSRRRLLSALAAGGAATVLAACGGGGSKSASGTNERATASAGIAGTSPTGSANSPQWDQTVAAAKKEGKVVVNLYPGAAYDHIMKSFTEAFPGIKEEHTSLVPVDFTPRITQERKAGVFTWDVAIIPTSTALQVLRPQGVWDPIKPVLIQPSVLDDKAWHDGFAAGFIDSDHELTYAFSLNRSEGVYINTDQVKDGEIRSFNDLLAPKWKGKMVLPDVRTIGSAFWPMTIARQKLGDEIIKQLFVDQQPLLSRDRTQITDFMVRGSYPVGVGPFPLRLQELQRQGLGKNLKTIQIPEFDYQSSGSTLWLVNKAPHPNAATVFLNWLLSTDAQTQWAKEVQDNSRRIGVPPGNPDLVVSPGLKLTQIDSAEMLPEVIKTQDIAKQVIK